MSRSTMHTALGAVACALTLAVFLAFSGSLPESVPMQFSLTGEASTYWPRDAVVFGVPAACVAINLLVSARLAGRGEGRAAMYYIAPAIALLATAATVFLGTR